MNMAGVRFSPSGRVHFVDPAGMELRVDDRVLVEQEDGEREATVVIEPGQFLHSDLRGPMFKVVERLSAGPSTGSGRTG